MEGSYAKVGDLEHTALVLILLVAEPKDIIWFDIAMSSMYLIITVVVQLCIRLYMECFVLRINICQFLYRYLGIVDPTQTIRKTVTLLREPADRFVCQPWRSDLPELCQCSPFSPIKQQVVLILIFESCYCSNQVLIGPDFHQSFDFQLKSDLILSL